MNYHQIPLLIPVLATGYVFTVYLLLILAQRAVKMAQLRPWRSAAGVAQSQSKP